MDKITMEDVIRYSKLEKEREELYDRIEEELEEIASIYAKYNRDPFSYIEEFTLEDDIFYVRTYGHWYGAINSYYNIPVDYLFDSEVEEKIKSDTAKEKEIEDKKYKAKKLKEDQLEFARLKKKLEDEGITHE